MSNYVPACPRRDVQRLISIEQPTGTAAPSREMLMLGMSHQNLERNFTPRQPIRDWNLVSL